MKDEPKRDPMLREALRRLEGDSGLRDDEFERLSRALSLSAAESLARLRRRAARTWRDYLVGWGRALVPAAAAAALAFLLFGPGEFESREEETPEITSPRAALAMAFTGDLRAAEAAHALAQSDQEAILAAAAGVYEP